MLTDKGGEGEAGGLPTATGDAVGTSDEKQQELPLPRA
nr:hypothetical protein [Klebsiella oxytoca]